MTCFLTNLGKAPNTKLRFVLNLALAWLMFGVFVSAQDISIDVRKASAVQTVTPQIVTQITLDDGTPIGGTVRSTGNIETKSGQPVGLFFVKSTRDLKDENNVLVKIKCETSSVLKIGTGVYAIGTPGTHSVTIIVLGQNPLSWEEESFEVPVGSGPTPPPGPTPDNVPNEYGVGKVAFDTAPRDSSSVNAYAKVYKQAGDFLFGVPSLKFIDSSNSTQSRDPNRSVLAWLRQQQELIPCTDQATCQQWSVWREKVGLALVESQKRRQFTRQDWYNAFNEISRAVGMVR